MNTILDILRGLRPEFDFSASENFIVDGFLDSFDVMTLIADLEKRYSIVIDGLDIVPENVKSVEAIEKLLAKYGVDK